MRGWASLTARKCESACPTGPNTDHVPSADVGWRNAQRIGWMFTQNRRRNRPPGPDPYPGGNYDGSTTPATKPR